MQRFLFVLLIGLALPLAHADKAGDRSLPIAIIGTGEVGSALGVSWGRLGHPIIYGSRKPNSDKTRDLVSRSGDARAVLPVEAAQHANIVVLAMPFAAALELLPKIAGLDGKILIDPMNALVFDDENGRVYQSTDLLAEQLQQLAPQAHVVKALSTLNAGNMDPERSFDGPISVPVAGDDPQAKIVVMKLIEELHLDATDVGPLFNARFIEAMGPLYVYMNFFKQPPEEFEYSFSSSGQE